MSSDQLVSAYVEGRISRRTLIRRLAAAGVSMGAAVSYAHLLAPDRATAGFTGECSPEYPTVAMAIRTLDLQDVIENRRLRVRVRPSEPMRLHLTATTIKQGEVKVLGERNVEFVTAERRIVRIDLDTVAPLRNREQARVTVTAERNDEGKRLCHPADPDGMSTSAVLT